MKTIFCFVLLICTWNAFAQGNDQPIAQELVGKWCYINLEVTNDVITNSCITLNAAGTFEATLDRSTIPNGVSAPGLKDNDSGKWGVKGSRFFYNSSSNGQGSFTLQKMNYPRLENIPMIGINVAAFSTASHKDAW